MREIRVPANAEKLGDVLEFIKAAMNDVGVSLKYLINISIVVEEILVNISLYAYPAGEGEVLISLIISSERIVIEFKDSGIPYDPLEKEDPDTSFSDEEFEIGGFGIFMVKNMMDDVNYRFENGYNILTLLKEFNE